MKKQYVLIFQTKVRVNLNDWLSIKTATQIFLIFGCTVFHTVVFHLYGICRWLWWYIDQRNLYSNVRWSSRSLLSTFSESSFFVLKIIWKYQNKTNRNRLEWNRTKCIGTNWYVSVRTFRWTNIIMSSFLSTHEYWNCCWNYWTRTIAIIIELL